MTETFKNGSNQRTYYLDENGQLVGDDFTEEQKAKWQKWNDDMMKESAEEIRERLGIDVGNR